MLIKLSLLQRDNMTTIKIILLTMGLVGLFSTILELKKTSQDLELNYKNTTKEQLNKRE
jgi:hypothetical protein